MAQHEVQIVLVENDPADAELALHALRGEKLGHRIEVLRDGEEALDFLLCRGAYSNRSCYPPPRLILLDLKLPKLDGLEVLREIKRDPRTRSIPVVILTSSKEETDIVRGYQLGVNSYIQKPVDFVQFRETIRQVGFYWLAVNQPPLPNSYL